MDTFYPKCSKSHDIKDKCCLGCRILKRIYFNLTIAVLDVLSMAHVVDKPFVKSLVALCNRAIYIYL